MPVSECHLIQVCNSMLLHNLCFSDGSQGWTGFPHTEADKQNFWLSAWLCPLNLMGLNMHEGLTGVWPEHTVTCEHRRVEA